MNQIHKILRRKLHKTYARQAFDNTDVWAGNLSVNIDGISYNAELARAYVDPGLTSAEARVRAEVYVAGLDPCDVGPEDLRARAWTDAGDAGYVDARSMHHQGFGRRVPMRLVTGADGRALPCGDNLVYESDPIRFDRTGVFNYSVELAAGPPETSAESWIPINDIAQNRDGVICVSPVSVRMRPSIAEVCIRKIGATVQDGEFVSGTFCAATQALEQIPADIVYLLPFFESGFTDLHTGEDVRKGELGSVYAVRDFYRLDPTLVGVAAGIDLRVLADENLLTADDIGDLCGVDGPGLGDLVALGSFEVAAAHTGEDTLLQIVGRAQLRGLVRRAHELGKQVIFDIVLKQTSRDCPLIESHPEWYAMDESGQPRIHEIAWLVYSDVALLDLTFNLDLQNYLSAVAPYWMRTCDFDGVRIDASQTIDRPFLKQIKNRINEVKQDALVLGETLCTLEESRDIPVDMVYALLVDYHRDAVTAGEYINFLEETGGSFPRRTVALAYFENHDAPRATKVWHDRYAKQLKGDPAVYLMWRRRTEEADPALVMALLRNLQASLINATAGSAEYVNVVYGLEYGTTWGEETLTDFESPTLLHPELAGSPPHSHLREGYEALRVLVQSSAALDAGHIYYHRSTFDGGDPEDRVLAYTRYTDETALLVAHNLDPAESRRIVCQTAEIGDVKWEERMPRVLFDTYPFLVGADGGSAVAQRVAGGVELELQPLQSVVIGIA